MDTKSLSGVQIKDADQGLVTAVFATLGTIDSDGDVTMPGAFTEGAPVKISAYGHQSWNGVLPVGKGTIHTVGDQAILDGQFFMNTAAGRDTFEVVKQLGDLQEWSYGYEPADYSFGEQDGQSVRFLNKQSVFEVSPTLRGAGVGTRLLTAKSAALEPGMTVTAVPNSAGLTVTTVATGNSVTAPAPAPEERKQRPVVIVPHQTAIDAGSWDSAAVKALPEDERPSALRSMHAWCDPDADPERKSSYRLAHHRGADQAANLRAVVAGAAALNSADGAGVPEADRKAAYAHLAAHMRDADMDPPEFGSGPASGLKFFDHGAVVLAAVSSFVDRASEVMALRATKGKGFSPGSADLLSWIQDETVRLKTLLTPPPPVEEPLRDDELSTLMAAQAIVQNL